MPLTHGQLIIGPFTYERHKPENTLLYRLVERYYPELEVLMAAQQSPLPDYVRREFEA